MRLTPKKWEEFQHYKDRSPSWIKFHKRILDDFAFHRLPLASRALAPLLWLLASEYEAGVIDASLEEIAFRVHMTPNEVAEALNPLVEAKFFTLEQDASSTLADRKQEASLEKEREKQEKKEERQGATSANDSDFENFKKEYPRRSGSNPWQPARTLFQQALKSGHDLKTIISAAKAYRHECEKNGIVNTDKVAQAQTWLRQSRFLDYQPVAETTISHVFVREGTEAWQAWQAVKKTPSHNGGWYFETEYPPAQDAA